MGGERAEARGGRGLEECQVETETEEMETPQARRKLNPVPSPPPRVVAGRARWWRMCVGEQTRLENEWQRRWKVAGSWRPGIVRREVEKLEQEWERQWREAGQTSKEEEMCVGRSPEVEK